MHGTSEAASQPEVHRFVCYTHTHTHKFGRRTHDRADKRRRDIVGGWGRPQYKVKKRVCSYKLLAVFSGGNAKTRARPCRLFIPTTNEPWDKQYLNNTNKNVEATARSVNCFCERCRRSYPFSNFLVKIQIQSKAEQYFCNVIGRQSNTVHLSSIVPGEGLFSYSTTR